MYLWSTSSCSLPTFYLLCNVYCNNIQLTLGEIVGVVVEHRTPNPKVMDSMPTGGTALLSKAH